MQKAKTFRSYYVAIDGIAVGPRFDTFEAARAFTIEIEAGTVTFLDEEDPSTTEAPSAPEPQELTTEWASRMAKEA